ncbi:hypothetical protein DPMN_152624 [Dreissena polymorpha]|uniref:Uncharacterized protein n=1 Tax=Dreissena polymorpha TaxID=45954 RepID=A0A9D4FM63_DREPO|nr:hypothetical protein DPMN_152624 [Dreissena polymorpha]
MYGLCNMECSKNCLNESCSINGECDLGCATNFYGKKCNIPCPETCNEVVTGPLCLQENGICKNGLRYGTTSDIFRPGMYSLICPSC